MPFKALAQKENYTELEKLAKPDNPIFAVQADETIGISGLDEEKFGYMEQTLYLAKGSRIMLNRNVNSPAGIYNGAQGTIYSIIYIDGKPKHLIIDLDHSNIGQEHCFMGVKNRIVLNPIKVQPLNSTKFRIQFALNLGFGCTIHKIQG